MRLPLWIALFVAPSIVLAADRDPAFLQAMETLYQLDGRWNVEEIYPASTDFPEGATGRGRVTFEKALENVYVIGDYSSKSRDLGISVEGHAVLTFNEEKQAYQYWWFSNYGAPKSFSGDYDAASKALVFTLDGAPAGAGMRHTFTFKSTDEVEFTMATQSGTAFVVDVTVNYSRRGGTSRDPRDDDDPAPARRPKRPSSL